MPGTVARRALPALAALLFSAVVHGAGLVTEVYPLGFRTVDEVAPMLQPLVPPPGAVTGLRNQLVIRTTPENMAEVKAVLAALDHPPRSLLISVKRATMESIEREGGGGSLALQEGDTRLSAGGGPGSPGGARVTVDDGRGSRASARVYGTGSMAEGRGVQSIRTVEGHDAFISAGVELPVRRPYRTMGPRVPAPGEAPVYRRVVRGFYVRPMVSGDRVRVEIRSTHSRLAAARHGMARSSVADTVVTGALGDWLVVGRDAAAERSGRSGFAYGAGTDRLEETTLMLKVEVMP